MKTDPVFHLLQRFCDNQKPKAVRKIKIEFFKLCICLCMLSYALYHVMFPGVLLVPIIADIVMLLIFGIWVKSITPNVNNFIRLCHKICKNPHLEQEYNSVMVDNEFLSMLADDENIAIEYKREVARKLSENKSIGWVDILKLRESFYGNNEASISFTPKGEGVKKILRFK